MQHSTHIANFTNWVKSRLSELNSQIISSADPSNHPSLKLLRDESQSACQALVDSEQIDIETFTWAGMIYSSLSRYDPNVSNSKLPVIDILRKFGPQLGVATRFLVMPYVWQEPDNLGRVVSFTTDPRELLFMRRNKEGIQAYSAIANALVQALNQGSFDQSKAFFDQALFKLASVRSTFKEIINEMEPFFFFSQLVPFYAPVVVDGVMHRPADARDQPGVFRTDLLLGVASPQYIEYDLMPNLQYLPPDDQAVVRADLGRKDSLLSRIIKTANLNIAESDIEWTNKLRQSNLIDFTRALLTVAHAHADLWRQHIGLVKKFMHVPLEASKHIPVYGLFRNLLDGSLEHLEHLVSMRSEQPTLSKLTRAIR